MTLLAEQTWRNLDTHYLQVLQSDWYRLVMELDDVISMQSMLFYAGKGLRTLHLPITTGTISSPMGLGSDSSPVRVTIAGQETYLADSMQFMLEYGCRVFPKGTYYIMPSFRGEDADRRHLCQFYHSEAEISGSLEDVMRFIEDYVGHVSRAVLDRLGDKVAEVAGGVDHITDLLGQQGNIPRIRHSEAIDLLNGRLSGGDTHCRHAEGFDVITHAGEQRLMEYAGGPVWLTHFDHASVPFYQAFEDECGQYALNADLLLGIGETVGCGERHQSPADVQRALDMHQVARDEYEWYCRMKEGMPLQTSGFGMGIERYLLWVLRHDDIRDCQVLPRFNGVDCLP